jgi:hypothetical protein
MHSVCALSMGPAADATVTLSFSVVLMNITLLQRLVPTRRKGNAPGCLLSSNFEFAASLFQNPKGFVGCRHDSFLRAHRRSIKKHSTHSHAQDNPQESHRSTR